MASRFRFRRGPDERNREGRRCGRRLGALKPLNPKTRFETHLDREGKPAERLDMAELQLSVLSRQCLGRRIPDRVTLDREVAAWLRDRQAKPIDWRFTAKDARIKLKKLYPSLQA
jgi:hypothetical protein